MLETVVLVVLCLTIAGIVVAAGVGVYFRERNNRELNAFIDVLSAHLTEIDDQITAEEEKIE